MLSGTDAPRCTDDMREDRYVPLDLEGVDWYHGCSIYAYYFNELIGSTLLRMREMIIQMVELVEAICATIRAEFGSCTSVIQIIAANIEEWMRKGSGSVCNGHRADWATYSAQ